jgi:HSP90 family molecular chaperone
MQITTEKRNFETFGTEKLQTTAFKVKQSREMFKLLSSNIYSDKVSAVIRELSANAWDAHRMAGKQDVPFEVHMPNSFEPFFYVKDFGTGLSKENIIHLYTTYGESTKTKDNETTGCFGIGSKSPFAYTDQFTITSRFNGVKYVYNCFVNDDGIPTVAPVAESETTEENGLEVNFAVDTNDFRTLCNLMLWVILTLPWNLLMYN